ncbi:MAG: hypothetical protein C0483_10085 [Pirellula sp.]|nr:hypothetical protein [Pirellula sp.]
MIGILQVIAIISMMIFVRCVMRARVTGTLSVIDFFAALMLFMYGPLGLFDLIELPLSGNISTASNQRFLIGIIATYISLSAGIYVASQFQGPILSTDLFFDESAIESDPMSGIGFSWMLVFAAVLYVVPFLVFPGAIGTIVENGRYALNNSRYTYTEIRRILAAESPFTQLTSRTRYTSSAIIIAALANTIFLTKRAPFLRIASAFAAMLIFIVCIAQLNKLATICTFAVIVLSYQYYQLYSQSIKFDKALAWRFFAFGIACIAMLMGLYSLQYREQIQAGHRSLEVMNESAWYRVVANHVDGLRLWFDLFPNEIDFVGLDNVPLFNALTGSEHICPPTLVADAYIGKFTSLQSGFIGTGYATFGFPGVIVISVAVGYLVRWLTLFQARLCLPGQRCIFSSVMSMNMYWLSTLEFQTGLLSGGALSVPLMFIAGSWCGWVPIRWNLRASNEYSPASFRVLDPTPLHEGE